MNKINWRYKIGDRIIDYNDDGSIRRDLLILDKEIRVKQLKRQISNEKWYKCRCNICSWDNMWKSESHLYYTKRGCACCQNQVVIRGINDLATTNPDLIKYFDNIDDTYTHTKASDKYVRLHCPSCNYKKFMTIHILYAQGFSCPICNDGYSYPEKLFHSILKKLKIKYIFQLSKRTFEWCDKFRYDFYLPDFNTIIEVHGSQHYGNNFINGRTELEEKNNDNIKKQLALDNAIKHYVTIDAKKSNLLYIKNSILNSELSKIIDLSNLDWNLCGEEASKSLVVDVCKYYEINKYRDDFYVNEITKKFHISKSCIVKYLKNGNDIGLCRYDAKESLITTGIKNGKRNNKTVYVYDTDYNFICEHKGITSLEKCSMDLLGGKIR